MIIVSKDFVDVLNCVVIFFDSKNMFDYIKLVLFVVKFFYYIFFVCFGMEIEVVVGDVFIIVVVKCSCVNVFVEYFFYML